MASHSKSATANLKALTERLKPTHETSEATSILPSSEAVAKFTVTCKNVIASKEKAYVKDKGGKRFMTIDHKYEYELPTIDVSAQFFRDNFARCSYLVRSGMNFKLSLRGVESPVYVRRHTRYSDPLDEVIELWWHKVEDQVWRAKQGEILAAIAELKRSNFSSHDDLVTRIQGTNRGLARMAQGLLPFNEELSQPPSL